jgi:hypothetical protein
MLDGPNRIRPPAIKRCITQAQARRQGKAAKFTGETYGIIFLFALLVDDHDTLAVVVDLSVTAPRKTKLVAHHKPKIARQILF